jgi:hypothetical protein
MNADRSKWQKEWGESKKWFKTNMFSDPIVFAFIRVHPRRSVAKQKP